MSYSFLRSSRRELAEAAQWYEDRRDGLGDEFLADFEHCIRPAVRHPDRFSLDEAAPAGYAARQVPFRGFPYRMIYLVRERRFVILAIAHAARRPGYWMDRLEEE